MFEPMFRNTLNVGGIPAQVILLGLALVLMVINLLVVRRLMNIEPETHNFRATAPDGPNWLLRVGLGLGFFALALVAIALPR